MNPRTERRLSRRMRYRSRSVAVSAALGVIAVALTYIGVEAALAALTLPPLLLSPVDLTEALTSGDPRALAVIAGLVVLAVFAIVAALTPGGRARHELADDRAVFLIDDDVMAGGISRAAALGAGVSRTQVTTTVGRRRATVRVRPSAGFPVDAELATNAADQAVSAAEPLRAISIRTAVDRKAVLA